MTTIRLLLGLAVSALLSGIACSVRAQPANDDFANAEVIAGLPFNDQEPGIIQASVNAEDPWVWCRGANFDAVAIRGGNNLWYRYTPTVDSYINLSTGTANRDTLLGVYTGSTLTTLQPVAGACGDGYLTSTQAFVAGVRVRAGETYWIVVSIWAPGTPTAGASMGLRVNEAPRHVVTKTSDSADGACNADCSLREAIDAANLEPGAVLVPAGEYVISLSGKPEQANASGDLDIVAAMAIYGAGQAAGPNGTTIRNAASLHERAFDLQSATPVLFQGFRITGTGDDSELGGAISSTSTFAIVSLDDVTLIDNDALRGGGMYAFHVVRITRSNILDNESHDEGGGGLFFGSTFPVWIEESTIAGNASLALFAVENGGGGILAFGALRISNSTVAFNESIGSGGGIRLFGMQASLGMVNSTVTRNIGDNGGVLGSVGGGVSIEGASTLGHLWRNNVVARNYVVQVPGNESDCRRTAASSALISDWNLVKSPDVGCTFSGSNDITLVDPMLAATMADNGGPTLTIALIAPSPAIDSGDVMGCTDFRGRPLVSDQRGVPRPQGSHCDRGAYERVLVDPLFANGFE